jgi:hypothetical protein
MEGKRGRKNFQEPLANGIRKSKKADQDTEKGRSRK